MAGDLLDDHGLQLLVRHHGQHRIRGQGIGEDLHVFRVQDDKALKQAVGVVAGLAVDLSCAVAAFALDFSEGITVA